MSVELNDGYITTGVFLAPSVHVGVGPKTPYDVGHVSVFRNAVTSLTPPRELLMQTATKTYDPNVPNI